MINAFRAARRHLSNRFLYSLAATVILAVPATATGGTSDRSLVVGMAIEPIGLDPTIAAPVAIGQVTWQNVFEGLVTIDRDGNIKPQLAKSWNISPDGLTYTFKLQREVTFHDGETFDSAVAKASLERARGADSVNPQKRFFASIAAIETPDAETLVLKLKEPAGSLLYWLAWPSSVIVGTRTAASDKTTPVGTGPFRFVRWAKGDKVDLAANPDYWNKEVSVGLDNVTFRFISDPQAQAAALKSGDVDAFPEFGAPELVRSFKDDPNLTTVIGNTELKVVAGMNNARKPFNDKRVRQALMMALDRKTLVDGAWSGFGTPIGSHYTPNDPGFIDLTGVYPYDLEKAKALLKEAGYPDGFSFVMRAPQMAYAARSAEIMQAMFAEIGVKMSIEPTEFPAKWVQEVFKNADYDMTIVAHAEPMDVDIYGRDSYYFNYMNPTLNDLIRKAEQTTDPATRDTVYGDVQKILAEDLPALYLFVMPKLGIWNKRLEGLWRNEPIPSNVLTDVRWRE